MTKTFRKSLLIALALLCVLGTVIVLALSSAAAASPVEATAVTYEQQGAVPLPTGEKYADPNGKYYGSLSALAENYTKTYIVAMQKQLGGSHYAYTEGVSDDFGSGYPSNEAVFRSGSKLVKLILTPDGNGGVTSSQVVLLSKASGVIRDPDVSPDGKKVVFSMKTAQTTDDYHLYIYDLARATTTQITFGQGVSDTEPKFLADGSIVFSSSRDEQRVDCWYTVVSNLYKCDADGSNIRRLGYDQVHTTYPTVTSDGRILYTRWDYNDRNQMYIQAVFQMNPDGTGQTELYGNDINWPSTLLHTREVYGSRNKYVTIISGHHVDQGGQIAFINLDKGANNPDAIEFLFSSEYQRRNASQDKEMMTGYVYKYPYAINENELLYAKTANSSSFSGGFAKSGTVFNIYYCNLKTGEETLVLQGDTTYPASQIVPVIERNIYEKESTVNYGDTTSTYYVSNVYEGQGLPGIEPGSIKYIRVVALDFRAYSIGAIANVALTYNGIYYAGADPHTPVGSGYTSWDVKDVIGLATVYEDGSALFSVPSETPVFFQLLDEDYNLVQSMRSWSTLQRGEVFSCVGCHEQSGTTPISTGRVTMAMKAGVQQLAPDLWMDEDPATYEADTHETGFSYLETIQPILDANCVSCHTNMSKAYTATGTASTENYTELFPLGSYWYYKITSSSLPASTFSVANYSTTGYTYGRAAFGTAGDARAPSVCNSPSVDWSSGYGYFEREFTLTAEQASEGLVIYWQYDENPVVYVNGQQVLTKGAGVYISAPKMEPLTIPANLLKTGTNVIAVRLENKLGGRYFDLGLYSTYTGGSTETGPISLTSERIYGNREKMYYPVSYLVLTGSKLDGDYYSGNWRTNPYLNWIPAISQSEILTPYQFGSASSEILKLLRNESSVWPDHPEVHLTEQEIAAFSCWIDLAVPMRGEYSEEGKYSSNDYRVVEELTHKQDFYNTLDAVTKDILGGIRDNEKSLTVSYVTSTGVTNSATGTGLVNLYLAKAYAANSRFEITLPSGEHYVWFSFNSRVKPQLLYAPEGTVTLTLTNNIITSLPAHVKNYTKNNIYVWLPTEEELKGEYNLAYTPFAGSQSAGVTVTASSTYDTTTQFLPMNGVDGFCNNRGHGYYPVQSWGPTENPSNLTYTVNFGRKVTVDHLVLYIRADFDATKPGYAGGDHDTYLTSLRAMFFDGNGQMVGSQTFNDLEKTYDGQLLQLDAPVECESVRLGSFVKNQPTWFAITELEAYGTNVLDEEEILPGDVNGDGLVSIQDVTALLMAIANGNTEQIVARNADVNGDGVLSIQDVTAILQIIAYGG